MPSRSRIIALYGRVFKPEFKPDLLRLFEIFRQWQIELVIYQPFAEFITKELGQIDLPYKLFKHEKEIPSRTDFLISIGGDGTFLEAIPYILDRQIPIAGINSGRLGFLSDISSENIEGSLTEILSNDFSLEERSLVEIQADNFDFQGFPFALNDVSIHKLETASMITVHTYIDNEFLNSYWADGLIISTPTGSTAYSLSSGGPIVHPQAQNLIITPIAPHTLTVRPLVIPDHAKLGFRIDGRSDYYLVSVDHRSFHLPIELELTIQKSIRSIRVIKPNKGSFFTTLRNKLMWGIDRRN